MFARIVRLHLKPGSKAAYTKAVEDEIYPKIKKYAGFVGQFSTISTDEKEGIGISLWQRREDAEAYHQKEFVEVAKVLGRFSEGKPEVHAHELTNSTFEEFPIRKAA